MAVDRIISGPAKAKKKILLFDNESVLTGLVRQELDFCK